VTMQVHLTKHITSFQPFIAVQYLSMSWSNASIRFRVIVKKRCQVIETLILHSSQDLIFTGTVAIVLIKILIRFTNVNVAATREITLQNFQYYLTLYEKLRKLPSMLMKPWQKYHHCMHLRFQEEL